MANHEHGKAATEALDPMHDYREAARLSENPQADELRLFGRLAMLFAEGSGDVQRANAKKAQDTFDATVAWWKNLPGRLKAKRPQETLQPQPAVATAETDDDFMRAAVARARANLGELPEITMHQEPEPQPAPENLAYTINAETVAAALAAAQRAKLRNAIDAPTVTLPTVGRHRVNNDETKEIPKVTTDA